MNKYQGMATEELHRVLKANMTTAYNSGEVNSIRNELQARKVQLFVKLEDAEHRVRVSQPVRDFPSTAGGARVLKRARNDLYAMLDTLTDAEKMEYGQWRIERRQLDTLDTLATTG